MNYIKNVPGNVIGKGDSKTDILTLLGLEVSPLDNKNDGRGGDVISSVVIGDKQYALSDVLTALASAIGGGSFSPDISNPQDGDTLVYDAAEEKWVNGSGGSGGNDFIITVEFGQDDELVADKTFAEIKQAYAAGKTMWLFLDGGKYAPVAISLSDGELSWIMFDLSYFTFDNNKIEFVGVQISFDADELHASYGNATFDIPT